jgi:hypothetical protein
MYRIAVIAVSIDRQDRPNLSRAILSRAVDVRRSARWRVGAGAKIPVVVSKPHDPSASSVSFQISALMEMGYLSRDTGRP